jgi:aminotransferase EvaB
MRPIPFNNLSRHWQATRSEVHPAVDRVLASGRYVLGREVETFEAAFASYCGATECVGVGNGTDALELALRAFECGPGDRVITAANAGGYATTAILAIGAVPRYIDIDEETLALDTSAVEAALQEGCRFVVATHLWGRMLDMSPLADLTTAFGARLIEDCAQAHGARWDGRFAGTWGDAGCFSFYPTKNLGAIGDGGAVVVRERDVAERLRMLRQYGWAGRFNAQMKGGRNSRLDPIQSAVLATKLLRLEEWNERRRTIAEHYDDAFGGAGVAVPRGPGHSDVVHLYPIRAPRRLVFQSRLDALGIGYGVHYPVPDHRQPALSDEPFSRVNLPNTERAAEELVSLPCFPELADCEVDRVIEAVIDALKATA